MRDSKVRRCLARVLQRFSEQREIKLERDGTSHRSVFQIFKCPQKCPITSQQSSCYLHGYTDSKQWERQRNPWLTGCRKSPKTSHKYSLKVDDQRACWDFPQTSTLPKTSSKKVIWSRGRKEPAKHSQT